MGDDDPGDDVLLAQLDLGAEQAWVELLALDAEFAATPHAADDYGAAPSRPREDGVIVLGFPVYGERVERARRVLAQVGAVTPAYPWMGGTPVPLPEDGSPISAADAVRIATATVRGERFCDGFIGQAVENGRLQAVLSALAAWYRERLSGRP